jgi:hypothetical protein
MAIKQKRDRGLKIMMTETTFTRLNELGELLGQSPSTLASLAVSNLINQYMGQEKIQTGIVAGFEKVMTKLANDQKELVE